MLLDRHLLTTNGWQPFFIGQYFIDGMYTVQNKGNWIKELNILMMKSCYAQVIKKHQYAYICKSEVCSHDIICSWSIITTK